MKLTEVDKLIVTVCKKAKLVRIITTGGLIIFAEKFKSSKSTDKGIYGLQFERAYIFSNENNIFKKDYTILIGIIDDIEFSFSI